MQERIVNRIRQYGLYSAVLQLAKATIRPIYQENRDLVFVIPNFSGYSFSSAKIIRMSHERIEKALATGELDQTHAALLTGFLDAGCQGVCAEVEGRLAGYAWVQLTGEYTFGRTGRMSIPPQFALFKNLFVLPDYRGMRFGPKLNAARLALVPAGYTPVVFIIPDNRYAIRNWEHYGFQRVIEVKRWQWLQSGTWRTRLSRLSDHSVTVPLLQALEASGDA